MKDLQRVVYPAVTDPHFRAKLADDPKAALASTGLRLGADERQPGFCFIWPPKFWTMSRMMIPV